MFRTVALARARYRHPRWLRRRVRSQSRQFRQARSHQDPARHPVRPGRQYLPRQRQKLTAWVQTNKPGSLDILLVKKGGAVAGPYTVTTVKGANGVIMGNPPRT